MPQGDLVFFPYDVTVVLGAYLVGYAIFVSLFAPRLVLIFRARARLNQTSVNVNQEKKPFTYAESNLRHSLRVISTSAVYSVSASEFLLQTIQFALLLIFLYFLAANKMQEKHFKVEKAPVNLKVRPNFEVANLITNNLLLLWSQHRNNLFYQPAAHALFETTHQTLQLLQRGVPPSILPRLLSVVRSSKGLNAI